MRPRIGTYCIGFALSLVATLMAYSAVRYHMWGNRAVIGVVVGLALAQFVVQLVFFLHLNGKDRWRLLVFGFMVGVVAIVAFGSLWIMHNLDYRMSPSQTQHYMQGQDGL